MIMRKCPKCGAVWYSANSSGDWVCYNCSFVLPEELNEIAR
jgi:transcription initiation factor TFIIIB Brf1 subunit/transcription initiation factor TFIIB